MILSIILAIFSNKKAVRRSIPPPIWERDEGQSDEEIKEDSKVEPSRIENLHSQEQKCSHLSDSDTKTAKADGLSKVQTSSSSKQDKQNIMQSSSGSTSSLASLMADESLACASSQIHSDAQSGPCNDMYMADFNPTGHNAVLNDPIPQITMISNWKDKRQCSVVSSTSRSDATGCTFDEVESIDFDLQHDVNLVDIARSLHTLSKKDLSDLRNSETDTAMKSNIEYHASWQSKKSTDSHLDSELSSDSSESGKKYTRLLIEEDEEDEPLPFARHTFNKRRLEEESSQNSNASDSEGGGGRSKTKVGLRSVLQHILSQSKMSHSTSQSSCGSSLSLPYHRFSSETPASAQVLLKPTKSFDEGKIEGLLPVGDLYDVQNVYDESTPAENTLMSLGFTSMNSFLPERFARDWQNKIIASKRQKYMEELKKHQDTRQQKAMFNKQNESRHPKNKGNHNKKNTSDFVHKLDFNSRMNASSRRARFRRVASVLTPGSDHKESGSMNTIDSENQNRVEDPVVKQDSLDQLKSVLERQAKILDFSNSKSEKRRRQFLSKKQKSLPLFLDTLSEEDIEGKLSDNFIMSERNSTSDDQQSDVSNDKEKAKLHESQKTHRMSAFKSLTEKTIASKNAVVKKDSVQNKNTENQILPTVQTIPTESVTVKNSSLMHNNSKLHRTGKWHPKIFKRSFSIDKDSFVEHGSIDSDLTSHRSGSECGNSTYASSLSENICSETPGSLSSSVDMDIKDIDDPESPNIIRLSEVTKQLASSPITHDEVSLGQTSFGKKNGVSLLSPRWSSSELDETPVEEQASGGTSPLFYSISMKREASSSASDHLSPKVPAITVSRSSSPMKLQTQSSSSLEIAEIMGNRDTCFQITPDSKNLMQTTGVDRPGTLPVVPAMVSVVLNDVGRPATANFPGRSKLSNTVGNCEEYFLRAPSPGNISNLSSSPAPLSPITVIEMDHLDNQGDSMDSGSGDIVTCDNDNHNEEGNVLTKVPVLDTLHPILEASDEGGLSTGSRAASFDSTYDCHISSPHQVHVGVEADDGQLSPVQLLGVFADDERESAYSSAVPSDPSTERQSSSGASSKSSSGLDQEHNRTTKYSNRSHHKSEASVQTEVESLSPIMFQVVNEHSTHTHDQYYIACEKSIQCNLDGNRCNINDIYLDKCTQTSTNSAVDSFLYGSEEHHPVYQPINKLESYEKFERSFSDFEPQILHSQGMQTDGMYSIDNKMLPSWLCSDCKVRIINGTEEYNFSNPETRDEKAKMQQLNDQACDRDCPKLSNLNNKEPNECRVADRTEKGNSTTKQCQKPKFSPTLLVQEMLDRSISMTDYIQRNISIPEHLRLDIPEMVFSRAISVPEYVGGSASDMASENKDGENLIKISESLECPEQIPNLNVNVSAETEATDNHSKCQCEKTDLFCDIHDHEDVSTNNEVNNGHWTVSDDLFSGSTEIAGSSRVNTKTKKPNINDFMDTMYNIPGLVVKSCPATGHKKIISDTEERTAQTPLKESNNFEKGDLEDFSSCEKEQRENTLDTVSVKVKEPGMTMDKLRNFDAWIYSGNSNTENRIRRELDTPLDCGMPNTSLSVAYGSSDKTLKSKASHCDLVSTGNTKLSSMPSEITQCKDSNFPSYELKRDMVADTSRYMLMSEDFENSYSDEASFDRFRKKLSRKRKAVQKVDSWLERSFSLSNSSTTVKVSNNDFQSDTLQYKHQPYENYFSATTGFKTSESLASEQRELMYGSTSSHYVPNQLHKEKKLLKRMLKRSKRWMRYFDKMDKHREKMFDLNHFPAEYYYNCGKISKQNYVSHQETDGDSQRFLHHETMPAFNLEHLLSRIDHIEDMIKTVTNSYSGENLDFEKVSRQLSKNSDILTDDMDEIIFQTLSTEPLPKPQEAGHAAKHSVFGSYKDNPALSNGCVSGTEFQLSLDTLDREQVRKPSKFENILTEQHLLSLGTSSEFETSVKYKEPYKWHPAAEQSMSDNTEYLLRRLKEIEESIATENDLVSQKYVGQSQDVDIKQKDVHHFQKDIMIPHSQHIRGSVGGEMQASSLQNVHLLLNQPHAIDETRF